MSPRFGLRPWFTKLTPGVRGLITITAAIHVALLVFRLANEDTFWALFPHIALVPGNVVEFEFQGLFTTLFVHDPFSIFHVILNLMVLYFLGPMVEKQMGARRFVTLYLGAGLCGSVVYTAWALLFSDPSLPAVGASGSILGVLVAFALLFPNAMLRLLMFAPMRARNLIWLALALDLVILFSDSSVAVPAHLGGMLGGFLIIRRPWRPAYRRRVMRDFQTWLRRRR